MDFSEERQSKKWEEKLAFFIYKKMSINEIIGSRIQFTPYYQCDNAKS